MECVVLGAGVAATGPHGEADQPPVWKPSVRGNKNDRRDAEVMGEAVSRPHMRWVPLKTVESQDIQAIHRMRGRLVKERPALVNQVRPSSASAGRRKRCRSAAPYSW